MDVKKRNNGGQMAAALNQETSKPLRNHCRGNIESLRHLQEKMRDQKVVTAQREAEDAQRWKMKQFENVKPRHREDPEKLREARDEQREKTRELREHLRKAQRAKSASRGGVKTPERNTPSPGMADDGNERIATKNATKPSVPRVGECTLEASANKPITRNFVNENRQQAQEMISGYRSSSKEMDDTQLKSFQKLKNGVPQYLREIKHRLAEDKRKASEKIDVIPPGYRVMGEEERLDTLVKLRQKKAEAETAWRRLPLKIETEGQKKRQMLIQNEIKEFERMVTLFEKPRVLVEM